MSTTVPSIWRDIKCTHCIYISLVIVQTCYFMKLFNFLTFLVGTHNKPCSVPFPLHLSPSPEQNNLLCLFPTAGVTLPCNPTTPLHCQLASLLTALRRVHRKALTCSWNGMKSRYRGLKDSVTPFSVFALHLYFSYYNIFPLKKMRSAIEVESSALKSCIHASCRNQLHWAGELPIIPRLFVCLMLPSHPKTYSKQTR